jgi:hypothetical protein
MTEWEKERNNPVAFQCVARAGNGKWGLGRKQKGNGFLNFFVYLTILPGYLALNMNIAWRLLTANIRNNYLFLKSVTFYCQHYFHLVYPS